LTDAVATALVSEIEETPFFEHDVYDDCDTPLNVTFSLLHVAADSSLAAPQPTLCSLLFSFKLQVVLGVALPP
jgi:hypothetical protein